jgi:hypothetical protein
MPSLVLVDDDGRELFRGAVSQENVEIIAGFVARHMETFRGIAAFKQALNQLVDAGELRARPPAPRPRPRRRRAGR